MVSAIETVGTPLRLLPLQILPQLLDPVGLLHGLALDQQIIKELTQAGP
ncbi:hypothetical protein [Synechococcus sp. CBW1108]|nr:hypothetical protein [Synechococcus sp. CBW1108]QPN57910.1 hypothetical protein I1E95_07670 [Synechococcus sp. CBW1107]QPN68815.1 hypothetical protein H8F27_08880 [Synechococcus sp. CBW1108]